MDKPSGSGSKGIKYEVGSIHPGNAAQLYVMVLEEYPCARQIYTVTKQMLATSLGGMYGHMG